MARDILPPNVLEALKAGNKIEAIKIIREATRVGLAEAKRIADEIEKQTRSTSVEGTRASPTRQGLAPGEVYRTGSPTKWLALAAIAAIAVIAAIYH